MRLGRPVRQSVRQSAIAASRDGGGRLEWRVRRETHRVAPQARHDDVRTALEEAEAWREEGAEAEEPPAILDPRWGLENDRGSRRCSWTRAHDEPIVLR
jgi:hypothetical protein